MAQVSAIRLQLAVVARRLRNARNMLRRLESMVPDDASMGRRPCPCCYFRNDVCRVDIIYIINIIYII